MADEKVESTETGTDNENFEVRYKKLLDKQKKLEKQMTVLTEQNTTLTSELSNAGVQNEINLTFAKAGIEDESISDYIKFKYSNASVEEGQEKSSFSDFFNDFKAADPAILRKAGPAKTEVADTLVKDQTAEVAKQTQAQVEAPKTAVKAETPAKDTSLNTLVSTTMTPSTITPKDFTKLTVAEQDALFASMGLGTLN